MILRFKEGWLKGRNPYDHLQTAGPSGWSFGKGQPIQMIICKGRQQGAEGAFLNRLSFWNFLNAFWTGTADKLVSLEEVSLWKEVLSYHFKRVSLHWRGSEEVSCSHWGLRLRCYSQKKLPSFWWWPALYGSLILNPNGAPGDDEPLSNSKCTQCLSLAACHQPLPPGPRSTRKNPPPAMTSRCQIATVPSVWTVPLQDMEVVAILITGWQSTQLLN